MFAMVIAVQSLSMPMFMSCCGDAVRRGRLNDVTNVSRHGTVIGRERERERAQESVRAKRWRLSRAVGASRLARRVGMR